MIKQRAIGLHSPGQDFVAAVMPSDKGKHDNACALARGSWLDTLPWWP